MSRTMIWKKNVDEKKHDISKMGLSSVNLCKNDYSCSQIFGKKKEYLLERIATKVCNSEAWVLLKW